MRTIKYNKYIDKIGIEFEGFWSLESLTEMSEGIDSWNSVFSEIKGDGSLSQYANGPLIPENYKARECITKPLGADDLNIVLHTINTLFNEGSYKINDSVGLHFHISLNGYTFGSICTPQFFGAYVDMFKKRFNTVYEARKNSQYCAFEIRHKYYKRGSTHFSRQSRDRYTVINYCLNKHKTVEFRGYGGQHATIEELADMIQATINLIKQYANIPFTYKRKFGESKAIRFNNNFRYKYGGITISPEITIEVKNEPEILERNLNTTEWEQVRSVYDIDRGRYILSGDYIPFTSKRIETIINLDDDTITSSDSMF